MIGGGLAEEHQRLAALVVKSGPADNVAQQQADNIGVVAEFQRVRRGAGDAIANIARRPARGELVQPAETVVGKQVVAYRDHPPAPARTRPDRGSGMCASAPGRNSPTTNRSSAAAKYNQKIRLAHCCSFSGRLNPHFGRRIL